MIGVLLSSVVLIGTLSVLAYRLAVYALPALLGFAVAQLAYSTGAGWIGAGVIGFIVGSVGFGLLSFTYESLRSPIARLVVGLVFAAPAAVAGYALVSGIVDDAVPSLIWQRVFAIAGAGFVGISAYARLAFPTNGQTA